MSDTYDGDARDTGDLDLDECRAEIHRLKRIISRWESDYAELQRRAQEVITQLGDQHADRI